MTSVSSLSITQILNTLGVPAFIYCGQKVLYANDALYRLTGHAPQSGASERSLAEILHPMDHARLTRFTAEKPSRPLTLHLWRADGTPWRVQLHLDEAPYAGEGCRIASLTLDAEGLLAPLGSQLPVGVYRTLRDATIVYANDTLAHILGFERAEDLIGTRASDYYPDPEDRERNIRVFHQQNPPTSSDIPLQTRDGRLIWVRNSRRAYCDDAGEIIYFEGTLEDITHKHQRELEIAQRHKQMEALNQVSIALSASLDLDETLAMVLHHLQHLVPFDSASVLVLRDDDDAQDQSDDPHQDVSAIASSPPGQWVHLIENRLLRSPLMQPLRRGEPVIVDDTRHHPAWEVQPGREAVRAMLGVPLVHQEATIGVLLLDKHEPHFYTDEHLERVLLIARQAAIALSKARHYQRAQAEIRRRETMQTILIDTLAKTNTLYHVARTLITGDDLSQHLPIALDLIANISGASGVMLITLDPSLGEVRDILTAGPKAHRYAINDFWDLMGLEASSAMAWSVIFDRFPAETPYTTLQRGDHNALIIRLKSQGVFVAFRPDLATPFTTPEIELVVALSGQVAIALENASLYRRLRRYNNQLEMLVERRTTQLSIERKRLQIILDATGEGIFYTENYLFHYANPALCRMLHYPLEALFGQHLSLILADEDEYLSLPVAEPHAAPSDEPPPRYVTQLRRKDGSLFPASLTFTWLELNENEAPRLVAVVRDISRESELEQQRDRFLGYAAHELRTPLTTIVLRLHMLRRQPERLQMHLDNLDLAVNYMRHLVEELVDLNRFAKGRIELSYESVLLAEVIEQIQQEQELYSVENGVQLHIETPEAPLSVTGDRHRLYQALTNLVVNGLNHASAQGHVRVRLRRTGDAFAEVSVSDDGDGIAADLLPDQIFVPFTLPSLGNMRGSGMGLALVKEIITLHGGQVHVTSAPGEGSTFTVRLPLLVNEAIDTGKPYQSRL